MKFCDLCGSFMTKTTTSLGEILFTCKCMNQVPGEPSDTLMAEEYLETGESNLKHQVFIEQSPYDSARSIVLRDCPNCSLPYLTFIRIGTQETSMYTCDCGFVATNEEYNRQMSKSKAAPKQE